MPTRIHVNQRGLSSQLVSNIPRGILGILVHTVLSEKDLFDVPRLMTISRNAIGRGS